MYDPYPSHQHYFAKRSHHDYNEDSSMDADYYDDYQDDNELSVDYMGDNDKIFKRVRNLYTSSNNVHNKK